MPKVSATDKKEMKKTLSKWRNEGGSIRVEKALSPMVGGGGVGLILADVISTGGLGTMAYTVLGIGGAMVWGDCVFSIDFAGPNRTTVRAKPSVASALKNMQEQAHEIFCEMSKKPQTEQELYVQKLKKIEHDAQVLKPLYRVFNAAGEVQDNFEYILQNEWVEKNAIKKIQKLGC